MKQTDSTKHTISKRIKPNCDITKTIAFSNIEHLAWAKFFDSLGIGYVYTPIHVNRQNDLPFTFFLPEFNHKEGCYIYISDNQPTEETVAKGYPVDVWVVPPLPRLEVTYIYNYDYFGSIELDEAIITDRSLNSGYRLFYNPVGKHVGSSIPQNYLDTYCNLWQQAVKASTDIPILTEKKAENAPEKPGEDTGYLVETRTVYVDGGVSASISKLSTDQFILSVGTSSVVLSSKQWNTLKEQA